MKELTYFSLNDSDDNSVTVDADISFSHGTASDGTTVFCPRLLLFDYKSRFGSLAHINALYSKEDENQPDMTWSGSVVEHRQEPIPQSSYHARLDAEEDDGDMYERMDDDTEVLLTEEGAADGDDLTSSIRFWSDFSRVYFHPRGLHRVPDPPEWQREIGWAHGAERFAAYDAEHVVLEDSFRLYAEECDLLQGVQLSLDAPSFGAFTISLLSQFREEYPKLPLLSFCSLSQYDPAQTVPDDTAASVGILNDALTLHELASLSTVTVPLQCPTTWRRGQWSKHIDADFANPYHSSALMAAHIESATLPLRVKASTASSTDLASFCAQLTWRGDTPLAALSGAIPTPTRLSDLDVYRFDYSHPPSLHKDDGATPFAQRDVFRDLYSPEEKVVQDFTETSQQLSRLREPFLSTSYFGIPYPISSSHPQFFTQLSPTGRPILSPPSILSTTFSDLLPKSPYTAAKPRVSSLPLYTTLRTGPLTGMLVGSYARFVEHAWRNGTGVAEVGVEREMLGEVREQFWTWSEGYTGEVVDEGELGEDERDLL